MIYINKIGDFGLETRYLMQNYEISIVFPRCALSSQLSSDFLKIFKI